MAEPTRFVGDVRYLNQYEEISGDKTLTKDESGKVVVVTGGHTLTLPPASDGEGMVFTCVAAAASSTVNFKPGSGDGINGVINDGSDASALITCDGTDDNYLTDASGNAGDRVTVISDGSGDWYILDGAGPWSYTS
jgi:hypothetical protein